MAEQAHSTGPRYREACGTDVEPWHDSDSVSNVWYAAPLRSSNNIILLLTPILLQSRFNLLSLLHLDSQYYIDHEDIHSEKTNVCRKDVAVKAQYRWQHRKTDIGLVKGR